MLAKKLKKQGIKHNVLNAKQHEREAEIVAQAGRHRAVTISTNMAGRGTDIVLGGNPEFLALDKCGHDKDHAEYPQRLAEFEAQCEIEREQVVGPAVCTSWGRSATRAGASTISCAAARAVRATPARASSSSHSRTTCCGSSSPSAWRSGGTAWASRKVRPSRTACSRA